MKTTIISLGLLVILAFATIAKLDKDIQFRNCIVIESMNTKQVPGTSIVGYCETMYRADEYKGLQFDASVTGALTITQ